MHERDVIADAVWGVIGSLFPPPKATGRRLIGNRVIVEAVAWRFRTGAPWRDLPERFGRWNTVFKRFNLWAKAGMWERLLDQVQSIPARKGDIDWVVAIDSTIQRVHQHGDTLARATGG